MIKKLFYLNIFGIYRITASGLISKSSLSGTSTGSPMDSYGERRFVSSEYPKDPTISSQR